MDLSLDPIEILNDPRVKNYLLSVLESSQYTSEQKYEKILDFFKEEARIRNFILTSQSSTLSTVQQINLGQIYTQVSQELHIFDPDETQHKIEICIRRAIRRLNYSQHDDGGWGVRFRESDCWSTAYAVLCLDLIKKKFDGLSDDIDSMLVKGLNWINDNRWSWAVDKIPLSERIFIYELSMVVACYYQLDRSYFNDSFASDISRCVDRLIHIQNKDGGWEEARGKEPSHEMLRKNSNSEVGATSYALRAIALFAAIQKKGYSTPITKGLGWIFDAQDKNVGYWHYQDFFNNIVKPSISKTCDALQIIFKLADFDHFNIENEPISSSIEKAIIWIESREKPIIEKGKIEGWAWPSDNDDYERAFDLENTCLTFETLILMPEPPFALLTSSANWLMKQQYKEDDVRVLDPKDIGKWDRELTARITYSLVLYYGQLKQMN